MDDQSSFDIIQPAEEIFKNEMLESSEDPPWEEWSSFNISLAEPDRKRILHEQGKYDPGINEVCTKYITISDSAVFRHPFYNYPPLLDNGIMSALQDPERPVVYPDDGQDLYLHLCEEMTQIPIRTFHRDLLKEEIDLRYYCVNPQNVRAMGKALQFNNLVKIFNLTDSFLTLDACFHLGEMLGTNDTLYELNLSGCRIGPEGLNNLLFKISYNRALKVLNLQRNVLGDEGMTYLADAVFLGLNVVDINLSQNQISGRGAACLAEALETHNDFTHIDLSWNNLMTEGIGSLLARLAENTVIKVIDLSWNFLSGDIVGLSLSRLFECPHLEYLILRNNKLCGEAIQHIAKRIDLARKLVTLDLSQNPLVAADVLKILKKIKQPQANVKNVFVENVIINQPCKVLLEEIKRLPYRKDFVIKYEGYKAPYVAKGRDARELILNRIDYLLYKKPKKNKIDFALFGLQLLREKYNCISLRDLPHVLKLRHVHLDGDLVDELATNFPGPPDGKLKSLNISLLCEYMARIWPDRKLPKSPPPELEPKPKPPKEKGKEKAKKK